MILKPPTLPCRGLCLAHVESLESKISFKKFNKLEGSIFSDEVMAASQQSDDLPPFSLPIQS
jgi:hypothetical protein